MTKQEIAKGIATYQYEQKLLIRVIKFKGGCLVDDEFDRIFSRDVRKLRWPIDRFSFILSWDPYSPEEAWISLAQCMCHLGLLKREAKGSHITYSLP